METTSRDARIGVISGLAAISPISPFPPLHQAHAREHSALRESDLLEDANELQDVQTSNLGQPNIHARNFSHSTSAESTLLDDHTHNTLSHDHTHNYTDDSNDSDASGSVDGEASASMPNRNSKSRSPHPRGRNSVRGRSAAAAAAAANGSVTSATQSPEGRTSMNGSSFLERRKTAHAPLEVPGEDSADATARLMGRNTFSLDEEPPMGPESKRGVVKSKGLFELPEQDRRNFFLLVLLYFLQGIPMGLAGGSVPFLLKSHLSYSQIGVYSLASYPYSLKLLWSPIVDAVWSAKVGRRKSWILPIQTLSGFGMIWLGMSAEQMMVQAGENGGAGVWGFTGWWFALVFMCATQDIAVDGWALTLLSQSNLSYASTAQTVGLTAGQFLSYTVFLALSSPDFANKYFRSTPQDVGLLTLNSYLQFWGWAYLLVTLGLALLKREERTKERDGLWDVYKTMGGILTLRNIQIFIVIHLIAKIGFQANDAVTNLKLLDKGFSQEDLALTVLIDFPFEISLGYYAGKWSEQYQAVTVWCWAFMGRLVAAVFAQLVVMFFPPGGTTTGYLLVIIVEHVFSTFMNTVMFVAISAFHAKIADPVIGGTYMTLLATVSNLGGTFPRFFILRAVDAFTKATCTPPTTPPDASILKGDLITQAFGCVAEVDKQRCIAGGGTCNMQRDGYYIVNVLCVLFGVVTFWGFIKPAALKLQALPLRAWRLSS